MKSILTIISLLIFLVDLNCQVNNNTFLEGKITFVSSKYYYVAYENTNNFNVGDTLYYIDVNYYKPALIIKYLSAKSVAGEKLVKGLNIGSKIYRITVGNGEVKLIAKEKTEKTIDVVTDKLISANKPLIIDEGIKGRASITSYSSFDNFSNKPISQRWRYQISANENNILNSNINFESYILFTYRTSDWGRVKRSLGNALKIYDLNISYKLNEDNLIWLGRRINNKISNIGTTDGIQYEMNIDNYFFGAVFGSRPNNYDYGFNAKLFQFGFYAQRQDTVNKRLMSNTVSIFNQTNNFKTDRRFIYLQHTNNIIENVNLFISSELDLYRRKSGITENNIFLTSVYSSINYSPFKWFSVNTSYDARKNVIYYETFKTFADSLFDTELRQGLRIRTNFRLNNGLYFSFNYGYRFKNGDNKTNINYGGNIGYGRIPLINAGSNFSYSKIISSYLNADTYGINFNKELINGFLSINIGYRFLNYNFDYNNLSLQQNTVTTDLSFFLGQKLYLSLNYEGTFEKERTYGNIYLNLSRRF